MWLVNHNTKWFWMELHGWNKIFVDIICIIKIQYQASLQECCYLFSSIFRLDDAIKSDLMATQLFNELKQRFPEIDPKTIEDIIRDVSTNSSFNFKAVFFYSTQSLVTVINVSTYYYWVVMVPGAPNRGGRGWGWYIPPKFWGGDNISIIPP